ncbi:STAS domain-containing protein [Mycolicibacterium monacense]|uniref:Anti-sigma factor antagonist n=4 Tax=Mycobacteriaceae TaxID=1762 RepID=A0AAD1MXM3_MYCMB|nr:STAS domain-containing protein [Mycolicibacterium monacense]MDA4102221.1 anti-sigma factor antagonist [Mycolicibacterium monacense DSM 44395]OBB56727.1 anti-anti-sigma factor [Mycolicibacterium monacense]OBF52270.1 anti-anti-sigma factor [Mycolicibacterium monacense]ORB18454.1 anti-anti-sigma factor [Mycolicibacterium monacense DSM 44395]QHP86951.1 anti-sigma factor antagonist [Mycolicibacterium monacense DSM 44395]
MNLTSSLDAADRSATVRIAGELDAETTSEFVDTASRLLETNPGLRALRLDCADMTFCDSAGLSGLLLIERRTTAAGVDLHLDNRPTYFERVLDITGILEYIAGRRATSAPAPTEEPDGDRGETELG